MEQKDNFQESLSVIKSSNDSPNDRDFELDQLEYETLRKRVKLDQNDELIEKNKQRLHLPEPIDEDINFSVNRNMFEEQFNNMRALSFKTVSKSGQNQHINMNIMKSEIKSNKVDDWLNQVDIQAKNRLRKKSYEDLSYIKEENLPVLMKQKYQDRNRINTPILSKSFSSFEVNKKVKEQEKIKKSQEKKQQNNHFIKNNLDTQMMNEINSIKIQDEDQINQENLKMMAQSALINNLKFNSSILIQKNNNTLLKYENILFYKILQVDGYTIQGFYSNQIKDRLRIHLSQPITNKEFDRKIVSQKKQIKLLNQIKQDNDENKMNQMTSVEFRGKIYQKKSQSWQDVRLWLQGVSYNVLISPKLQANPTSYSFQL